LAEFSVGQIHAQNGNKSKYTRGPADFSWEINVEIPMTNCTAQLGIGAGTII
jgi:hypothetical protein